MKRILIIGALVVVIAPHCYAERGLFSGDLFTRSIPKPPSLANHIDITAKLTGISAPTIQAVIATESSGRETAIAYNPHADAQYGRMGSAAHGLMQVRGLWAGTAICPEASTYKDLYNPLINVTCGTRLLKYNLDKTGDIDAALAAYHAGTKCVKKGDLCPAGLGYVNKVKLALAKVLSK